MFRVLRIKTNLPGVDLKITIYWPKRVVTVCISYQIFPGIVDLTPPYNRCLNMIFRCKIVCV